MARVILLGHSASQPDILHDDAKLSSTGIGLDPKPFCEVREQCNLGDFSQHSLVDYLITFSQSSHQPVMAVCTGQNPTKHVTQSPTQCLWLEFITGGWGSKHRLSRLSRPHTYIPLFLCRQTWKCLCLQSVSGHSPECRLWKNKILAKSQEQCRY